MTVRIYNRINLITFLIASLFSGCMTAGTHGSLKSYEFTANKYFLQKAVEKIIASSENIKRDTAKNYIIDKTNNRNDTIFDNHYNDGDTYVSVRIKSEGDYYDYTFRYAGDKDYWETSMTSNLSIAYAYDKDGNGGSEGNGGVGWTLKSKALKIFERELISKIEKELNQKLINSD